MSQFAYEARDHTGALIEGLVSAQSVDHAGRLLSERSLFVVRLAEERAEDEPQQARGRATREQVAWLITQLSVMLETGIRLSDAFECLTRQVSDPRLRQVLEGMSRSILQGQPLTSAMAEYPRSFPKPLVSLIRASEMSGTMTTVMRRSADYLIAERRAIKRARGALMYPAFMLVLCLGVTVFLLAVILPKFAAIFASRQAVLPLPTRVLMSASDLLVLHWPLWLAGAAGVVGGGWYAWRTGWGRHTRDTLALRAPVLGKVFSTLYMSRSFRTLEVLMNAGVPLTDTVAILRDTVPNVHYRALWDRVAQRIKDGEPIAAPLLESDLFPEQIGQMLACGDETGKLGQVATRLAEHLEEEYNDAVKVATQFIEPCMILMMGLFIGLVAASLMLPMFQSGTLVGG